MFAFVLQLVIYFLCIYRLNGGFDEELFCENTKSGHAFTVTFYSKNDAKMFIRDVNARLDSIKDDVVYLDAPYGICFELHYIFYDDQWVIILSITPDDETSKPTPFINSKYESLSIQALWSLNDQLSHGTIVEPRRIKGYYQCSSYPECILDYVKTLVQNHTNWLITGGSQYIQLWQALENILIQSEDAETSKNQECYKNANKFGTCPKSIHVCKATIVDTTQKNQECAKSKTDPVEVYLKIIGETNQKPLQYTIDFTCNFNRCNSNDKGKLIRQTIDKQFDFLPFLTASLLKMQSTTTTRTSTYLTTTKRTNTTTVYSTTNYETQTSKLAAFSSIVQNNTQVNELTTFFPINQNVTRLNELIISSSIVHNGIQYTHASTTELITDNAISVSVSVCFITYMILLHGFVFVHTF